MSHDRSAAFALDSVAFAAYVEQRIGAAGPVEVNDWLGLVAHALGHAQPAALTGRREEALAWARPVVRIRAFLADHVDDPLGGFKRDEMMFRAFLIVQLGKDEREPLLDPNLIVAWFRQSVAGWRVEEARSEAEGWTHKPIEVIRRLRALKNRIGVLKELQRACPLPGETGWISVWAALP